MVREVAVRTRSTASQTEIKDGVEIVPNHHHRRRFVAVNLLITIGLLVLPVIAVQRSGVDYPWPAAYVILISALTYWVYAHDKRRAEQRGWRVPEASLHFLELLGGWPGGFLAQRRLRHKCSKVSYQFVFWLIVLLWQFAAVDSLQDWKFSKAARSFIERTSSHRMNSRVWQDAVISPKTVRIVISKHIPDTTYQSLSENSEGDCGEVLWPWAALARSSQPAAGIRSTYLKPATAWRVTLEAWLRCQGLIAARHNQKPNMSTTFQKIWSHKYKHFLNACLHGIMSVEFGLLKI